MAFVSSADQRATAESGVVVQMEILYIAVLRTSHAAAKFVPPFFNFSSLPCFLNPTVSSLSLRPLFLLHFHPVRSLVSPLRRPFCRSALLFAYSLTLYVFLYSSSFHTCLLRCSVHIPSSSSSSPWPHPCLLLVRHVLHILFPSLLSPILCQLLYVLKSDPCILVFCYPDRIKLVSMCPFGRPSTILCMPVAHERYFRLVPFSRHCKLVFWCACFAHNQRWFVFRSIDRGCIYAVPCTLFHQDSIALLSFLCLLAFQEPELCVMIHLILLHHKWFRSIASQYLCSMCLMVSMEH